jgi:hypothetical protein
MEACEAAPCSAADILPIMFKRKLDLHQTTFAYGRTVAGPQAQRPLGGQRTCNSYCASPW